MTYVNNIVRKQCDIIKYYGIVYFNVLRLPGKDI